MKTTISVTYYKCPVCGKNSTNKKEIEQHFKRHGIEEEEVIYCKTCGAGWDVNTYGRMRAKREAEECYKRHIEEGNADEVATETFFLSEGTFGYVKVIGKEV